MADLTNWFWKKKPHTADELRDQAVVICDIDGVISDASVRQHFLLRSRPDWRGFFDACGDDDPIVEQVEHLDSHHDRTFVFLVTGRPIEVATQTQDWLHRHNIRWDALIMRDHGDYTASVSFKQATLEAMLEVGMRVELALDDDRSICEMYESFDVPVRYVHSGYYDRKDSTER